jgi:hypothetical protein
MPPLAAARVWLLPLPDYLRVIGEHALAWRAHVWCFALGAVLTAVGFVFSTPLVSEGGLGGAVLVAGLLVYALAAPLWLAALAFRLDPTVRAAAEREDDYAVRAFETLSRWAASLYAIYMVLAYLAVALFGAAFIGSRRVPDLLAWATLLFGAAGAVSFGLSLPPRMGMRSLFDLPALVHVPQLAIGIALLLSQRR